MSEMIERAARAIHDAMDISDGFTPQAAETYARAAIAAVREPTEDMIDFGITRLTLSPQPHGNQAWYREEASDVWRAMIDAMLHVEEPEG